ncbi:hypothetical protein SETIT_3G204600v2 [Setaria italica]|uniref:Uncharacterized protein n=1 Tax=Setaria italica TaxID=4555 RepID=A0A368QGZ0_SETIT|nr:hypothetical protein SETIT_3G204600v2 [Setaria italica]
MTTAMVSLSGGRRLWPAAPGLAAAGFFPSITGRRHVGHEPRDRSQASTQGTWNPCPHRGSTRTFSPSANSPRQMAHTSSSSSSAAPAPWPPSPPPPPPYTSTGMLRSARFLIPPAQDAPRVDDDADAPSPPPPAAPRIPHRSAHRASELSPMANSSAKKSAARMITMLVSKLASPGPPSPPVPFAARPAGALTTVAFPESRWSMTTALTTHPHARTNAPPSGRG